MKRWISFLFILVLAAGLCTENFLRTQAYAADEVNFDTTDVLDDLNGADNFNILNYPFDGTGKIKHPEILNIAEYCYSYRVNARDNYGLYLYFYNPQGLDIDTDSKANKVQIAVSYETDKEGYTIPKAYEKFDLQFCSVSTDADYYRLFYKFKVIDHVSDDGKTIAERVNSNARRYDISGIELQTKGDRNATEYTVGGTYTFTGYAEGYGPDENAESTLSCDVQNLETVRLDLAGKTDGVDKRTYWRSNSSAVGAHHQNQINSVFFAIDKTVLEKYGYVLQRIKAEWWEYKTRPVIVIDDKRIYDELSKWNGVQISENYDRTRGWTLHNSDYYYMHPLSIYDWSWNAQLQDHWNNTVHSNDIDTLLPLLFYTSGMDVNEYVLLPETLQTYLEGYDKSYVNGTLEFNGHTYSADLFDDGVDEGRTKGYNLRTFDIGNPDDYWDIRSYDDTHSWWDKLWDYGFGSIRTDDSYRDIQPIQMLTEQDFAVSDIAEHLKINPDDAGTLKDYYDKVKADSEVFLFRYAVTDYWAEDLSVFEINNGEYGTHHNGVGEIRQGTQFFDFDILEFTFNKDGVYTAIPVVSSPIDHISGYTPSIEAQERDWWKWVIGAGLLVLLILLLFPLLPYLIKGLVWIICLPFKGIAALFRAIKKSSEKRKGEKVRKKMNKEFKKFSKQTAKEQKKTERDAKKVNVTDLKTKIWTGEKSRSELSKAEKYALNHDEEWLQEQEIIDQILYGGDTEDYSDW